MTIETIDRLIASSRPRRGLLRGSRLALLGLGALLGAYLADPDLFSPTRVPVWLLPQIVLLILAVLILQTAVKQRRLVKLMLAGFEAVQLRQWDQARDVLVRLLRHAVTPAQARAESLLSLASVAEADRQFDAAQRIYEAVLVENAADPLQLHTARVALAAAMLRTDQTADAVDLIDRLARVELPAALRAQVELLSLFREVTMGQADAGLARAEQRAELFRHHLSTRAGFGYGLLAAAFDRANQPAQAQRYWHDATLLIRPKELLERFEELAPIAAKYPAAEFVL